VTPAKHAPIFCRLRDILEHTVHAYINLCSQFPKPASTPYACIHAHVCWHCPHSMRSSVYETVRCSSVRPSVCPSMGPQQQTRCCCRFAAGLLLRPGGQDIDCCSSGMRMRSVPRCWRTTTDLFQVVISLPFARCELLLQWSSSRRTRLRCEHPPSNITAVGCLSRAPM